MIKIIITYFYINDIGLHFNINGIGFFNTSWKFWIYLHNHSSIKYEI